MGVSTAKQSYSDTQVMELVNITAEDLEEDAPGTLETMNPGQAPYLMEDGLYSFVYYSNTTIVGHATNIQLMGVNLKGKTDVTGKACRDEMLAGALANGTGWNLFTWILPWPICTTRRRSIVLQKGVTGKNMLYVRGSDAGPFFNLKTRDRVGSDVFFFSGSSLVELRFRTPFKKHNLIYLVIQSSANFMIFAIIAINLHQE